MKTIKQGTRVKIGSSYPTHKATINDIVIGDVGTVLYIQRLVGQDIGIALVKLDGKHTITANTTDLDVFQ